MQINVLKELKQPVGSVNEFVLKEDSMIAGDLALSSVTAALTLLRTDRGLLASVRATAQMSDSCARCLKPVLCAIDVVYEEEYIPRYNPVTGARLRAAADAFRIGNDFVLDLRESFRQYALMSAPAKPLCSPLCAGLCPGCGADLNEGSCTCEPEPDPRLSALAGLRIKFPEGS
jgi:uncharacterized protein